MKNGIVFVSDQRLLYMAEYLKAQNVNVKRITSEEEYRAEKWQPHNIDFVMLPIRGTSDGKIEIHQEKFCISDLLESLPQSVIVMSGITTEYEKNLPCQYINFQDDKEFVKANSKFTAEGVLYLLLSKTSRSLYDYQIDILGAGKSGKAIYELLHKLDLRVKLVSKTGDDIIIDSKTNPIKTIPFQKWEMEPKGEVIINTIPDTVLKNENQINACELELFIDISSGAVGVSDEIKKKLDKKYFKAPPLPGIVAPKSAGEKLAELIRKYIR